MNFLEQYTKYYIDILVNSGEYQQLTEPIYNYAMKFKDNIQDVFMFNQLGKLPTGYQVYPNNNLIVSPLFKITDKISVQAYLYTQSLEPIIINGTGFQIYIDNANIQANEYCHIAFENEINENNIFLLSNILHIHDYYLKDNSTQNFAEYIESFTDIFLNKRTEEALTKVEEDEVEEEENKLKIFIQRYLDEIDERYMENDIIAIKEYGRKMYFGISDILKNKILNQQFKLNKMLETFEQYSPIFDSIHLDKQIYLTSQYYDLLSIRPIIEFSKVRDNQANDLVNIDFIKLEITYFDKLRKEEAFDCILTLVPYDDGDDEYGLNQLISLMVIFLSEELSLFDNFEDPENRFSTNNIEKFLEILFGEIVYIFKLIKNPMLKRNAESNFLGNNRNYNERDLDAFIDRPRY